MIHTNEKLKKHKIDFVLLGISILFYLFFPLMDGPVWCVDSNGYAAMNITREPIYPIFLALCQKIAGGVLPACCCFTEPVSSICHMVCRSGC